MSAPTLAIDEEQVRAVLARCVPRRDGTEKITTLGAGGYDIEAGRRYLSTTVDEGLAVPTWPSRYGGRDAGRTEVAMISRVHADYALPDLYPFRVGMKMAGPTLLEHGTAEQNDRWLRRMASGEDIWCQLFSEPDAGSDLANVSTMAVRDGDVWRLDGQKVWTSRGDYSDWGICLARTDPSVPKHDGVTMFSVRMDAPGVEVRPLVQMNGDSHFSEVFLSGAVVPDTDRIGEVNGGWKVTVSLLAHERAGADRSAPTASGSALPMWLTRLSAQGALTDPSLRDRAMALLCLDEAIRLTQLRAAANQAAGRRPGPEGSGQKLNGSRSFKERVSIMAAAAGADAMLSDWSGSIDVLTSPSMSIRGGTDEIQRNILAERVLGLPTDARTDRNVAWSLSRRGLTHAPSI
ncbi:MAG: acyl-CoA dehydrogenase family protein [Acidimicrobiia bacterium]